MPGLRLLWAFLLLPLAPALSGCTGCLPEGVEAALQPVLDEEDLRALPMLRSGATSVAGVTVPDSHGRVAFDLDLENITRADVRDVELEVRLGGAVLPIQVVRTTLDGEDWGPDGGEVRDGQELALWWTVDRDRSQNLLLSQAAPYVATLTFHWEHEDCSTVAEGDAEAAAEGFVREPVVSQAFQADGQAKVTAGPLGASFEAPLRTRSGITLRIEAASAILLRLPDGADAPAVAAFPDARVESGGREVTSVAPATRFTVEAGPVPLAPPAADGSGRYLLLVEIEREAADGTVGADRDMAAWLVEA